MSRIDIWFLDQLNELVEFEEQLLRAPIRSGAAFRMTSDIIALFQQAKAFGYSDAQLSYIWRLDQQSYHRLKTTLDRPKFITGRYLRG